MYMMAQVQGSHLVVAVHIVVHVQKVEGPVSATRGCGEGYVLIPGRSIAQPYQQSSVKSHHQRVGWGQPASNGNVT